MLNLTFYLLAADLTKWIMVEPLSNIGRDLRNASQKESFSNSFMFLSFSGYLTILAGISSLSPLSVAKHF